jgi:hypothetical protein
VYSFAVREQNDAKILAIGFRDSTPTPDSAVRLNNLAKG